jgi:hypothetical protein
MHDRIFPGVRFPDEGVTGPVSFEGFAFFGVLGTKYGDLAGARFGLGFDSSLKDLMTTSGVIFICRLSGGGFAAAENLAEGGCVSICFLGANRPFLSLTTGDTFCANASDDPASTS